MRSRWPLLAILCVLASLLVPGTASASSAADAETRVGAFDLADQVRVAVERSLTLELYQGCGLAYDDLASDSLLAARGAAKFPGTNPAKAPKGFEWRGKPGSTPGSKEGNWYNPKTGESLRPDLDHPGPIGPHWDYRDPSGNWFRIFPDGSQVPK